MRLRERSVEFTTRTRQERRFEDFTCRLSSRFERVEKVLRQQAEEEGGTQQTQPGDGGRGRGRGRERGRGRGESRGSREGAARRRGRGRGRGVGASAAVEYQEGSFRWS